MEAFGGWLGLWHDIGKLQGRWQRYLEESEAGRVPRGGPDHKAAGALLASEHLSPFFALAIHGHHGGLSDLSAFREWLRDRDTPGNRAAIEEAARLTAGLVPPVRPAPPTNGIASTEHRAELLLRMLFSCLVDADWLDTEAHFSPDRGMDRTPPPEMEVLWRRFEASQSRLVGTQPGPVGDARDAIYRACIEAAQQAPGLFRLSVPTGGGKTRSAMAFALRHAIRHGQRRVVVAVPYISITEQTAQSYREIFETPADGAPIVLEHHSGAGDLHSTAGDRAIDPRQRWSRLAAENWDAPVVVTTTVQLFESLFDRRPGRMRKLHRLANSVLILDEVQSLPRKYLSPILDVLRDLSELYGTTVVLSTATQPAFEVIPEFARAAARELVPEPDRWFSALQRVDYERPDAPLSWEEVADRMCGERQALAIVNTKRDALALLDALAAAGADEGVLHLSTLLCGAHRRDVLAEVRRRLDSGEPCLLVSTQVVEAGVDIDFPVVLRAIGPLDAIVQAAGRCNRHGRQDRGSVTLFDPAEPTPLPVTYRQPTQEARKALRSGGRPDDRAVLRRYYEELLTLVEPDGAGIQPLREAFDFPGVARAFRMIDPTVPIVVRYGDAVQRERIDLLIERLRESSRAGHGARGALRELQPYIVQLFEGQLRQFESRVSEIAPGVFEWLGDYDGVEDRPGGRGIVLAPAVADEWIV